MRSFQKQPNDNLYQVVLINTQGTGKFVIPTWARHASEAILLARRRYKNVFDPAERHGWKVEVRDYE